jgi:hypothetical protein
MEEHVTRMVEIRNAHGILVEKSEVRTPLGRTRYGWYNSRVDLREIG